jgi:hypothetical protein
MSLPAKLVLPKVDKSKTSDLQEKSGDPDHAYSYGGKNPGCVIDNGEKSCSKNMYAGKRPDGSSWELCNWHAHLAGSLFALKCNCPGKVNILVGGMSGPRWIAYAYAEAHGYEDLGAADFTGNYCCPDARSGNADEYTCGDMYVCYSCKANHPCAIANRDSSAELSDGSESSDSSEDSDGPVPYIPMTGHIYGIKKGNAYSVSILTNGRGLVNVKTFADAMYVHQEMLEAGDKASALYWYALASHMPDRPTYIQPIVLDFE